jgi:hypothetical protein
MLTTLSQFLILPVRSVHLDAETVGEYRDIKMLVIVACDSGVTRQDETRHDNTQDRTGQDRTGQDRTEQDKEAGDLLLYSIKMRLGASFFLSFLNFCPFFLVCMDRPLPLSTHPLSKLHFALPSFFFSFLFFRRGEDDLRNPAASEYILARQGQYASSVQNCPGTHRRMRHV